MSRKNGAEAENLARPARRALLTGGAVSLAAAAGAALGGFGRGEGGMPGLRETVGPAGSHRSGASCAPGSPRPSGLATAPASASALNP